MGILNFFNSIIEGLDMVKEAMFVPVELLAVIPSVLGASVSVVLTIMIIKTILGR